MLFQICTCVNTIRYFPSLCLGFAPFKDRLSPPCDHEVMFAVKVLRHLAPEERASRSDQFFSCLHLRVSGFLSLSLSYFAVTGQLTRRLCENSYDLGLELSLVPTGNTRATLSCLSRLLRRHRSCPCCFHLTNSRTGGCG